MSTWQLLRLELGRTPDFPEGSASHAYTLRLPLNEAGLIDEAAMAKRPELATVRRTWPNEPDQLGYVIRAGKGWAFSYEPGEEDDEALYHLESHALRPGEYVTLTQPDGDRLPFRVASAVPDGVAL